MSTQAIEKYQQNAKDVERATIIKDIIEAAIPSIQAALSEVKRPDGGATFIMTPQPDKVNVMVRHQSPQT